LAKGREYAMKPSSYKSSLSHKLPTGVSKKRSRSPSPLKQNIQIIERKKESKIKETTHEKKHYSKEYLERQEELKKKYGKESKNEEDKQKKTTKKGDYLGPDVFQLG
jgi:pre-mRNA-splicing factor 38B